MCRYCVTGSSHPSTDRVRVLDLLALIEHPDALPANAALRIAAELLTWAGRAESRLRCEPATALGSPKDTVA